VSTLFHSPSLPKTFFGGKAKSENKKVKKEEGKKVKPPLHAGDTAGIYEWKTTRKDAGKKTRATTILAAAGARAGGAAGTKRWVWLFSF
jgi:hypothetical protein